MVFFWTLKRYALETTHFCRKQFEHFPLEVSFSLYIHSSLISEAIQYISKNRWDKASNQNYHEQIWLQNPWDYEDRQLMVKTLVVVSKVACICYSTYFWGSRKPYKHRAFPTLPAFFSLFVTRSKNILPEEIFLRNTDLTKSIFTALALHLKTQSKPPSFASFLSCSLNYPSFTCFFFSVQSLYLW